MENKSLSVIQQLSIAVAIILTGWFIYLGMHQIATKDRAVTVKGLSTRNVTADYVVWPLEFAVNGNDLPQMYKDVSRIEQIARTFFIGKGFKEDELTLGNISIDDNTNSYYDRKPEFRYTLRTSLIISTLDVQRVIDNQGCQSELLDKGVILNSYKWNTDYQYNSLSDIKPEMIEEATINARAVAQKFADDSHSRLGGIRQASQGQFSIETDNNQPWLKHVRVVTTIDYYLK